VNKRKINNTLLGCMNAKTSQSCFETNTETKTNKHALIGNIHCGNKHKYYEDRKYQCFTLWALFPCKYSAVTLLFH
jgi:hypothetical protein